jgi:hypothetical protein
MKLRLLLLFVALTLRAQTPLPSLTITSASLKIDPTATDSYSLQGTFQGLDFTTAQSVTLQVGPYSGTIPIGNFVQQGNLLTYQDSTGQTPYWISSLTIDTNATTFVAQATGIVLAGVADPFAVRLGTDTANGCSMARVQQMAAGAFQLTVGDGVNEPCQIPNMPLTEPPVVPVGIATNVTITIKLLPTPGFDASTLQAFVADGNGQSSGGPLCTFSQNSGTAYSCTASFNQPAAGMVPLIVQATAGPLRAGRGAAGGWRPTAPKHPECHAAGFTELRAVRRQRLCPNPDHPVVTLLVPGTAGTYWPASRTEPGRVVDRSALGLGSDDHGLPHQ